MKPWPRLDVLCELLVVVDDASAGEVVRRELHHDPILREDPDVVLAHLPTDVRQDPVPVLQLHPEHRVGERLDDPALDFDGPVLLRHVLHCPIAKLTHDARGACAATGDRCMRHAWRAAEDSVYANRREATNGDRPGQRTWWRAWSANLCRGLECYAAACGPPARTPSSASRAAPPSSAVSTHGPSSVTA